MKTLHTLIAWYRQRREARLLSREADRLAGLDEPYFSRDPVGFKADGWKTHLSSYEGRPNIEMLEIGSLEGRSAIWFCRNVLTGVGSGLTCVDPWHPQIKLRFDHNVRAAGVVDRIRVIQKPSAEALTEDLAESRFDLIYIDGNHDAPYVLFDALFSWPLLKVGGIMFFDDYGWRPDLAAARRPKPAIDKFLDLLADEMQLMHRNHQVFVRKQM